MLTISSLFLFVSVVLLMTGLSIFPTPSRFFLLAATTVMLCSLPFIRPILRRLWRRLQRLTGAIAGYLWAVLVMEIADYHSAPQNFTRDFLVPVLWGSFSGLLFGCFIIGTVPYFNGFLMCFFIWLFWFWARNNLNIIDREKVWALLLQFSQGRFWLSSQKSRNYNNPNLAHLPHHLVEQILLYLPQSSLVRFRLLSRIYRNYIDSQNFMYERLGAYRKTKLLIRRDLDMTLMDLEGGTPITLPNPVPGLMFTPNIVGSINGLVLLETHSVIRFPARQRSYCIKALYNPSTRQCMVLPHCPLESDCAYEFTISSGFGFDPVTKDYKIVELLMFDNGPQMWMFSFKEYSWTKICAVPQDYLLNGENGLMYMGTFCEGSVYFPGHNIVFGLHISKLELVSVEIPMNQVKTTSLTVVEGRLCIQRRAPLGKEYYWLVDNNWIHFLTVEYSLVVRRLLGKLIDGRYVFSEDGNFVLCDLASGATELIETGEQLPPRSALVLETGMWPQ